MVAWCLMRCLYKTFYMYRKKNGTLVGFVDMGFEGNDLYTSQKMDKGKEGHDLANHVIQFMFHGITGFRFPVAHYATHGANAPQIYSMFWDVVEALHEWGFNTLYSSVDGAVSNRSFIKMHFIGSPLDFNLSIKHSFSSHPISMILDPSHLFKEIRNNIYKSGIQKWHTRLLVIDEKEVVWDMFRQAYEWDKQHPLPVHQRLTNEHINPNDADKMRNHLAEEVLNYGTNYHT